MALAGCSTSGGGSTSALGAFASAGSNDRPVATSIVDAMAGGLVGASFGDEFDRQEMRLALEAEYRALEHTPAGQTVEWGRASDRKRGEVMAGSPYRVGSQNCRQYTHRVFLSGQSSEARGTACRNEDGSWTPLV